MQGLDVSAHPNVEVRNDTQIIYLKGDEDTDGSLRMIPSVDQQEFHFQIRLEGVWADASIQISVGSIVMGLDLQIESAGGWIITSSHGTSGAVKRIIPHTHFSDNGSFGRHSAEVGKKVFRNIIQPVYDDEIIVTSTSTIIVPPVNAWISKVYVKIGSVAATENVMVTLRRINEFGSIYFQREYPPHVFGPALTEVEVELKGLIQITEGFPVHVQIESSANLSFQSYSLTDQIWYALDTQAFEAIGFLQDSMTLTNDAGLVFSNSGDFVTASKFNG